MKITNVIPPPKSLPSLREINPRPLLPLHPAPVQRWIYPPVLPSPARAPAPKLLREQYELSTHILPSAYPRSTPYAPEPTVTTPDPSAPRTREQRREEVNTVAAELMAHAKKNVEGETFPGDPDGRLLWNVANRYLRKALRGKDLKGKKRLTLLFFHANGFPKEVSSFLVPETPMAKVTKRSLLSCCHEDLGTGNCVCTRSAAKRLEQQYSYRRNMVFGGRTTRGRCIDQWLQAWIFMCVTPRIQALDEN
jgi:hypothetical protein